MLSFRPLFSIYANMYISVLFSFSLNLILILKGAHKTLLELQANRNSCGCCNKKMNILELYIFMVLYYLSNYCILILQYLQYFTINNFFSVKTILNDCKL